MRDPEAEEGATIRLKSHPRYLRVVRAMVRRFGALAGLDDSRVRAVTLAVDEGCANMIRHSYEGRSDGDIEVCCRLESSEDGARLLRIRLRDRGHPVDPERVSRPAPPDPGRPGGLGLHLMHRACDSVAADPTVAEGNLIELTVTCPPVAETVPPPQPAV